MNSCPLYVDIDYETTAYRSLIFTEGVEPFYTLRCPDGCADTDNRIFGGPILYDQASAICKAAVHSGAIDHIGGIFRLNFETPDRNGYEASERRSIISDELQSASRNPLAIRVVPQELLCPIDLFALQQDHALMPSTSGVFLELEASNSNLTEADEQMEGSVNEIDVSEAGKVSKIFNQKLKHLYKYIAQLHSGQTTGAFQVI